MATTVTLFSSSFFSPPVKSAQLKSPPSPPVFLPRSTNSPARIVLSVTHDYQQPPSEVLSVVCPSLANANTLFFRSAYNVQVVVDDNEHEEKLLNRFRREVMKAGVIQECKRRRFFENKQDEKKRKTRDAARRNRRRRFTPRVGGPGDRQEQLSKIRKEDEDEDNWEVPDGDLPS